jgi:CDP-diacylglycerol pyrophosphatase
MDDGLERKFQVWLFCEPCWRGRVYVYMEQRKAKQNAADELPEQAVIRITINPKKHKTTNITHNATTCGSATTHD